jgi:PST family polysaccharide transporter
MDETPNWRMLSEWPKKAVGNMKNLRGAGIKGLVENILSLTVLQAATYLLPLITLPYLVRVLGADKFGLVAFAHALMQYFIIVTDYGFNLSATRDIAASRDNMLKVSQIFSTRRFSVR